MLYNEMICESTNFKKPFNVIAVSFLYYLTTNFQDSLEQCVKGGKKIPKKEYMK